MSDNNLYIATTVYKHLLNKDAEFESISYLRRRKGTIKEQTEGLQNELEAINVLLEILEKTLCLDCKGYGEFRMQDSQNESHLEKCKSCKGTGRDQPD